MIKEIAIFGIGAAVGFAGSWFLFKKKYEIKADHEIDEVKKYYLDKYLTQQKKLEKLEEDSEKIDKAIEDYKEKEEKKDASIMAYNKIGKEEDEVKAEAESPEEDEPTKPYLITEDEFLNDKNEYDKISLTYYIFDDTLADESDEMVDIEETISSDVYNQLADTDTDLYVRNNVLETDFEIMRVEGSFHDRYGGF